MRVTIQVEMSVPKANAEDIRSYVESAVGEMCGCHDSHSLFYPDYWLLKRKRKGLKYTVRENALKVTIMENSG